MPQRQMIVAQWSRINRLEFYQFLPIPLGAVGLHWGEVRHEDFHVVSVDFLVQRAGGLLGKLQALDCGEVVALLVVVFQLQLKMPGEELLECLCQLDVVLLTLLQTPHFPGSAASVCRGCWVGTLHSRTSSCRPKCPVRCSPISSQIVPRAFGARYHW